MAERLQKIIAAAGITSRRKAEELITAGRVSVNGKIITELGIKAEPTDEIIVDGKKIQKEEKVYFLMNKPKHTVCTLNDDKGRDTVLDYLPQVNARVFPVGRLDYDTTGVLLLTNDGEFSNKMIHPRHHLPKNYECVVDGLISEDEVRQIRRGIELDDGMTLPCKIHVISTNGHDKSTISITIYEGRNRQIKRMMEYFGYHVIRLDRKKFGFLDYGTLHQGEVRRLKHRDVMLLIEMAEKGQEEQH